MTLQQLKYVVTVAEMGTLSAAAKKLLRMNRGISLSKDGEIFWGYVSQKKN